MAAWLQRFGFGKRTGLDLSFEAPGLVGTPEWSRRVRKTPWYPGEAVSLSIGQGPMLATVAQLARAFAILANGGRVNDATPDITRGGHDRRTWGSTSATSLRFATALEAVVHGPAGTARRFAAIPMAGKTGTAQVVRLQEGVSSDELAPNLRHHAWFVSWAPLEEPKIVVSVIVEHGGDGSSAAAPVAAHIVKTFLARSEDPLRRRRPPTPETDTRPAGRVESGRGTPHRSMDASRRDRHSRCVAVHPAHAVAGGGNEPPSAAIAVGGQRVDHLVAAVEGSPRPLRASRAPALCRRHCRSGDRTDLRCRPRRKPRLVRDRAL